MQLYSTNNLSYLVSLEDAVLKGLPADNGLFMPTKIPTLDTFFLENIENYNFQEIAFEVSKTLLQDAIPEKDLLKIIEKAVSFPAPVVQLDNQFSILELFYGPSLAFKDFGARFMAQLMGYFNQNKSEDLVILVATSGDTGGAVAAGFHKTPGVQVVVLYPSKKVSPLQEKQLTTLGDNIHAIEVEGTFDNCQALVKQAFLDKELNQKIRLSSANSINIARLIPQSFYYFEAYKQLKKLNKPIVFCVPSGNFGNLTAGLFAQKMGLPVHGFIAATNSNDIIPTYLKTGIFESKPSISTISNAMDVGNPSNFARMTDLFANHSKNNKQCSTWNIATQSLNGYSINDSDTKKGIKEVFEKYQYIIDPHGSVGYMAAKKYLQTHSEAHIVILETAHPSKFIQEVESVLDISIDIPERLACLANKEKIANFIQADYQAFQSWLKATYA